MGAGTAGEPVVVKLPSEIDVTNSGAAGDSLLGALRNSALVIADMTGTAFCDSSGLRVLLVARNRAESSGAVLRFVVTPGGAVARSLEVSGFDRLLPICRSMQEALAAEPGARLRAP